jgi:hypothetical protein
MNENYAGYEFHTKNGSVYSLDSDNRIHASRDIISCRNISLEGSQVDVLQAIEKEALGEFEEPARYNHRRKLIELLTVHGKEPKKGRHLVVLLTEEDFRKVGSVGLVTSMLSEDPVYRGNEK